MSRKDLIPRGLGGGHISERAIPGEKYQGEGSECVTGEGVQPVVYPVSPALRYNFQRTGHHP